MFLLSYRSGVVPEVYPELTHGPNDGHEALYGVAVHDRLVLKALLPWQDNQVITRPEKSSLTRNLHMFAINLEILQEIAKNV